MRYEQLKQWKDNLGSFGDLSDSERRTFSRSTYSAYINKEINYEQFRELLELPLHADLYLKMNPRRFRDFLPMKARNVFDEMVRDMMYQKHMRLLDAEHLIARYFVEQFRKEEEKKSSV